MASRPTLAALLRDQPRRGRVRFVAALYAARGATTRIEGNVVHVDGERYLVAARWSSLTDLVWRKRGERVDCVVAVDPVRAGVLGDRYDARAVSAVDLDRLARYGLDRPAADAVYRERFGRPVAGVDPPAADRRPDATDAANAADARVGSHASTAGLVVVSVFAFLLVAALSGAGATTGTLPWVWDASETVSVSTPAGTGSGAPDGGTTVDATTASSTAHTGRGAGEPSTADPFAPGVSNASLTDVDALAAAHAAALGNRSYVWELEYVESVNGTVTARGTETVRVASRRSFVSAVDWRGRPAGLTPVASRPSYADGEVRHRPAADGSELVTYALTDLSPAGEQGWRASRYLRWYLSTTNASVERTLVHAETPTAVVEGTGTAYPNAEGYTVRAHVTHDGFVRSLSVSYRLTDDDGPPVAVQFNFRYRVDESVAVSPPAWHDGGATSTPTETLSEAPNGTSTPSPG
jgi:hypothetical protein